MKIRCSKTVLSNALSSLSRIIPVRTAHPVLSGFMMFTKNDTLVLQATDLELCLTITVPAQVEVEGCIVVAGRHLTELVRRLPDNDLLLQLVEETQQLEIIYKKASVRINTWLATDFPVLQPTPTQTRITLEGARWKNMMRKILFAAAIQEVRPNYAGVYLQFQSEQLKLVATDTYRLAFLKLPYHNKIADTALFIPVRPLSEVNKLLSDDQQLEVTWDQTMIGFKTKIFTLTARLMDAQFPAYEKVIPQNCKLRIQVDKELLKAALERAALFNELPAQQAVVKLRVEAGTLFIAAQAAQVGSLNEEITLVSADGEAGEASFTTRYLLEPLKIIDSQNVALCLNSHHEAALYLEEGEISYLHLVLPVRRLTDDTGEAQA